MQCCPFDYHGQYPRRYVPLHECQRANVDRRTMFSVADVEVRWRMIRPEHLDGDTVERADSGHAARCGRPKQFAQPFAPDPYQKSVRRSEETCCAKLEACSSPCGPRALAQYVNDRPYVASSFLSVAISDVFGSAMAGRSKERPALVDTPIPLTSRIAVVRAKGGEPLLRSLFEPLGYSVTVAQHHKQYFTLELSATKRVADLLAHVYVLLPVLHGLADMYRK